MNTRLGEFAFAAQSGFGVPAATPTWALPLGMPDGSGLPSPEVEWEPHAAARGSVGTQEVRRTMVSWQSDFSVPAYGDALAILLRGLLSGNTLVGSLHTLVPSTADTWFTFWSQRPGLNYERYTDGIIEGMRFDFTSGEPVNVTIQTRGREPEFLAGAYTPTNRADIRTKWLTYIGTEVKLDWNVGTPVTLRWEAEAGQLYISRPAYVHPNYRVVKPTTVTRGNVDVELPLELVFRDIDHYRYSVYGGMGMTPVRATVYGSATLKFWEPNKLGGRYLYFSMPAMQWDVAAPDPLSAPESGSVIVELTGRAVVPAVIGRTGPLITAQVQV